jgi:CRP/FNR family transcriptional regulator, cyclic AMP receptor protein
MTDNDRQQALRQSKLAAELTEEQCRVLSNLIALRDLRDGEILVSEGQSDNHLYAIIKGALCVIKNAGSADEVTLVTMSAGDFADELGFMDGAKHYASLMARGETRVLGIEREKLESLLPTHPDIVYKVMRAIIRAVHQIQKQLSMQSAELSSYIYKMHGRY